MKNSARKLREYFKKRKKKLNFKYGGGLVIRLAWNLRYRNNKDELQCGSYILRGEFRRGLKKKRYDRTKRTDSI